VWKLYVCCKWQNMKLLRFLLRFDGHAILFFSLAGNCMDREYSILGQMMFCIVNKVPVHYYMQNSLFKFGYFV
jgi:hypothetical protein